MVETNEKMSYLPSASEICEAAKVDDFQASRLLSQLLTSATETIDGDEARDSSKKACDILVEAWESCSDLEDKLVDSLWLQCCILSSPDGAELNEAEELTSIDDTKISAQEALIRAIQALLEVPGRETFYIKLQTNLLPNFLDSAGLASEEDLLKRSRIHNTQINYKQSKFNLLQEESEGYSKLVQFLSMGSGSPIEQVVTMRRLIGTFELDPNRVLDIAVDVLSTKLYPCNDAKKNTNPTQPHLNDSVIRLISLMKHLPVEKLPSVLRFKLEGPGGASQNLFQTIAVLVTESILNFSVMLKEYSTPIEDEIRECHKLQWMKEKKRIQGLSSVSLSGNRKEDQKLTELKERFQKELLRVSSNPAIHILCILLQRGEWEIIKPLMSSQSWEKLCCLLPERIGFGFCDIAEKKLDSWFNAQVGTPGFSKPVQTKTSEHTLDYPTVDVIIQEISESLMYTLHSGCVQYKPILYCKLCRLLRSVVDRQGSDFVPSKKTYDFFQTFLVPSLSLFGANPAISSEVWNVLKRLSYATRYRLYEDWKGKGLERTGLGVSPLVGKPLPVVESEMNAGKAARYALKRLSKDNIRDMSRLLAKATHSAPLVVYGTILNQIESYDNMVNVMVDAQRFSNHLGLDVLGFCILSRLSGTTGGVNRNRLKEDGANVSQWLQSLEAFSAAFFKRYPFVEFRGILSYLMRRLCEGQVMELGILSSLLKVAGGYGFADYSPAASLSVSQLEGRAGSFTLKRETMSFGIVEQMNLQAIGAIKKVLQSDGFGVSMLVLIAQARSRIIFESSSGPSKPVKLIGNLVDSCQVAIWILLEFLTTEESESEASGTAIEEYAKQLPPLDDLHFKFGLGVESSWMLTRPLARSVVQKKESDEAPDPTLVVTETFSFRKKYESMLPEEAWEHLSQSLFEFFYTNAVYDIFWPEDIYIAEMGRIRKEIERLEKAKTTAAAPATASSRTTSSNSDEPELQRLKKVLESLTLDKERQKQQVESTRDELESRKLDLINSDSVSDEASKSLLLYCIYPRSLLSPDDAMYCAHFAFELHRIETPGFSALHYIDELVSVAAGSLYGVTEAEAANLAILLWQTWSVVNRWRYDTDAFEKEVAGKPGSFMVHATDAQGAASREISQDDFIILYNSWHAALGAALIGCLESKEYMHTRAGLLVLTRLVDVFPTRPKLANLLLSTLEPLQDENSDRPDIRAAANAYSTMLLKARDDGKWKEEDASVAQARVDKEKAAAEKRKKKLEEQFEELQRDSEKITEEIGPDRRRDGRSFGGGRGQSGPGRPRDGPPSDLRDGRDRRSPPRELDRRNRDGDRVGDRAPPTRGGERRGGPRRGGLEDGRWVRGEAPPAADDRGGRAPKRGRGPSPDGALEERGSKRARLDADVNFEPRRDNGRGSSPPSRRGRGGPDPSRSSRSSRRKRG